MKSIKKIISTVIIFSLVALVASPALPATPADAASIPNDLVRVHLSSYGAPSSFSMNATGSHTIKENGAKISGAFTLKAVGGKIRLNDGGKEYTFSNEVNILAASDSVDHRIQINSGFRFPGDFRVIEKSGGLKLINNVNMEVYLAGVLPYEVSDSWPDEALKAQAVAARSYAAYAIFTKNRSSSESDLVNTTASQVYNGVNASNKNCVDAVNATSKQILKTPSGSYVYTCFAASNGGHTEYPKASGAAATNFSYLPFKADPYDLKYSLSSSGYSAKVTIPKSIAASTLKSSGKQPYAMLRKKMAAAGVNVSGLTGTLKVKSIGLNSPRYTSPSRVFTGAKITLVTSGGKTITLSFSPYINGNGTKKPFLNRELGLSDKSKFSMLYLRNDDDSFLLAATRYGHAAGLSQVGALQMAKEGKTYKDILKFYYAMGDKSELVTMDGSSTIVDTPSGESSGKDTAFSASGVVTSGISNLNVRSGPGMNYSILGTLDGGVKVTIIAKNGDWYKIKYSNGSAYVSNQYITVNKVNSTTAKPAVAKKTGTVANISKNGKLTVRSGPGSSYKSIGSLKKAAKVTITGTKGAWYKITYKKKVGYVSRKYIKVTSSSSSSSSTFAKAKTGRVKISAGNYLNVRSGPSTSNKSIGKLKNGAKVTITGTKGAWYKIKYKGKTAYVMKSYITLS